jgi:hypothetical protein
VIKISEIIAAIDYAKLAEKLRQELARLTRANKLKKFTVDLSVARTDASLVGAGLIPRQKFMSLTVWNKGTGTFSFKLKFFDGTLSESFSDAEVLNGDVFDCEFIDILWTNTAQTVTNPTLIVSWREV